MAEKEFDKPSFGYPSSEAEGWNADGAAQPMTLKSGDLFIWPPDLDLAIEWLVVEKHSEDEVLIVPVDDHPLAGSRDLELDKGALGRIANVRCGLDKWITVRNLDSRFGTGAIGKEHLLKIQEKREAIRRGSLQVTSAEDEIDGDIEYQDWMAELKTVTEELPSSIGVRHKPEEPLAGTSIPVFNLFLFKEDVVLTPWKRLISYLRAPCDWCLLAIAMFFSYSLVIGIEPEDQRASIFGVLLRNLSRSLSELTSSGAMIIQWLVIIGFQAVILVLLDSYSKRWRLVKNKDLFALFQVGLGGLAAYCLMVGLNSSLYNPSMATALVFSTFLAPLLLGAVRAVRRFSYLSDEFLDTWHPAPISETTAGLMEISTPRKLPCPDEVTFVDAAAREVDPGSKIGLFYTEEGDCYLRLKVDRVDEAEEGKCIVETPASKIKIKMSRADFLAHLDARAGSQKSGDVAVSERNGLH